ncbi:MAG: HAD family hydrolase [Actinomycetota bacterium]|nr:HAD family hydrolase [Actinomycetota bacterium]
MRLVLWDIDGTLLDSGGAGPAAFPDAFERVVGRRPRELAPMSGRTDWDIALDILERNGVEDVDALWPAYAEALAEALAAREGEMTAEGRALPGVREAIGALEEADGVVQTLLTGNIKPNAATKLRAFGLNGLLDLEIGAYGSDDRRRPALVAVARERAQARHGVELAPEEIVLIGDTPRDVEAGHANGARVVGVATGQFTAADLEEAGADAVLADLRDTPAVLAAVLAPSEVGS